MKTSSKGIGLIQYYEGCRLTAYKDAGGVPTIGYGHTNGVRLGRQTISKTTALNLLKTDLSVFELGVSKLVTVPLNQNQFDALVSFSFNVGLGALSKSTLLEKLNKKDYSGASEQFLLWNRAGGTVLKGLVNRRKDEQKLFLTSPPKPKAQPKKETATLVYPNKWLQVGSKGENVKQIQTALNLALDKKVVTVDGVYGTKTAQAVKDYQKRHHLKPDGIVGKETWKTLF